MVHFLVICCPKKLAFEKYICRYVSPILKVKMTAPIRFCDTDDDADVFELEKNYVDLKIQIFHCVPKGRHECDISETLFYIQNVFSVCTQLA